MQLAAEPPIKSAAITWARDCRQMGVSLSLNIRWSALQAAAAATMLLLVRAVLLAAAARSSTRETHQTGSRLALRAVACSCFPYSKDAGANLARCPAMNLFETS